jgi:alpha-beta hydrolase superfamily lysophospholipase
MRETTFRLPAQGVELFVHRWEPPAAPKAVVQIVHGMIEHGARYARTAAQLTAAGYAVYVHDHRGHGRTAHGPADLGYFADSDGWHLVAADIQLVRRRIEQDHPGLPLFVLGHSMGARATLQFLGAHGEGLTGAVLSGAGGNSAAGAVAGVLVGKGIRLLRGQRHRSKLLNFLVFGQYNKRFAPQRTDSDWLTRDTAEVDKYIADPLCGFEFTVQAWIDFLGGIIELERAEHLRRIPSRLPLYLFSGSLDPVGAETRGVLWLIDALRNAGVGQIEHRFYPDARHETLNETNRDEVHRDLIAWLDKTLAKAR